MYALVTTKHRGVFAGELIEESGTTVTLNNCRNCIRWAASIGGFLGLAQTGPDGDCKIGTVAPTVKLHDVTSISTCTDEARKAWEAAS